VGTHLQSKWDAKEIAERYRKYDDARAAWLARNEEWQKTWKEWQQKHTRQENTNAGRSISTAPATGTTARPATTEPSTIRIALNR
jgi:hypothetical protein